MGLGTNCKKVERLVNIKYALSNSAILFKKRLEIATYSQCKLAMYEKCTNRNKKYLRDLLLMKK